MNVVSRIQFPRTPETSGLYIKHNDAVSLDFNTNKVKISLTKNGVLSLNTYFNSFYETFYAKYTNLSSLYYLLTLEGDFAICLYREFPNTENKKLIHTENCSHCHPSKPVQIFLPDSWQSENAGRIYLEITCLSSYGYFIGGYVATTQSSTEEISLGIITCTFKKEFYLKKTINTILEDEYLQKKKYKIFVVDNGRTLQKQELDHPRVELIPNRNLGGAGGFTRGLIQALQEESYTHFLFMDDDIELESESIYRLFTWYEYANQDFAVSGSMLDLYKKHILYEAGALYSKFLYPDGRYGYNPFTVVPLKKKLNLGNSSEKNSLILEEKPDYGAFWFFSFSKKVVKEIGLPMPFFIRVDDIEFGLRITELSNKPIVAIPGIAVWHEPFYAKNPTWITYYAYRNHLVTHSIRCSLKYTDAIKFLTKILLHQLFLFNYNSAEMLLRAVEDYLKGPLHIQTADPEKTHIKILELSQQHKTQNTQSNPTYKPDFQKKNDDESEQMSAFRRLIALLTINGHLLPNFLLSNENVIYCVGSEHEDWWTKVFTKKRLSIFREGSTHVAHHEMSRTVGLGILIRWLQLMISSAFKWKHISSEWKNAFNNLTSVDFWKDYLKLNEQN